MPIALWKKFVDLTFIIIRGSRDPLGSKSANFMCQKGFLCCCL
jgi:hypothetical protein